MSKETIGFVGVGRMGANMARRLKDCGYEVTAVNDVNKEAAAELATEIGPGLSTPARRSASASPFNA